MEFVVVFVMAQEAAVIQLFILRVLLFVVSLLIAPALLVTHMF